MPASQEPMPCTLSKFTTQKGKSKGAEQTEGENNGPPHHHQAATILVNPMYKVRPGLPPGMVEGKVFVVEMKENTARGTWEYPEQGAEHKTRPT